MISDFRFTDAEITLALDELIGRLLRPAWTIGKSQSHIRKIIKERERRRFDILLARSAQFAPQSA